jgi:hypothetical protein
MQMRKPSCGNLKSGKLKPGALCWELGQIARKQAISDLSSEKRKIDFAIDPDELEKSESVSRLPEPVRR